MRTFSHLTQEERYHIYILHKNKISLGEIAKGRGRYRSTISQSCVAGLCGYRYQQAPIKAQQRPIDQPKVIKLAEPMKQVMTPLIEEKWRPEQIAGRFHEALFA